MIPLTECKDRAVYRLRSRSLDFGVFVAATKGFIGIREKFGNKYLFTEYHYDTGPPIGTAKPLELLDFELDPRIQLKECYDGSFCMWCGNKVRWTGPPAPAPWEHLDPADCTDPTPQAWENRPLRYFLDSVCFALTARKETEPSQSSS
jgi:hypothetical protein